MVNVEVTAIQISQRTAIFEGSSLFRAVQQAGSDFDLAIRVRTETTNTSGSAQLTEAERDSLLTLITAIEERLADEIVRH